jgi:hypothetical protein
MNEKRGYVVKRAVWFLTLVLILGVVVPIGHVSAATIAVFTIGSTHYTADQQTLTMDAAPYIKNSRTFLPLRFVANALGIPDADITYDDATQKVTIVDGAAMMVKLSIGSTYLFVNGIPTTMDVAPEIIAGRTFLPISWIAQALGFNATWDAVTQTVTLDSSSTQQTTVPAPPVVESSDGVVPALQYASTTATESKDFSWTYGGIAYTWKVEAPSDLLTFDRSQTAYVNTYFHQSTGDAQQSMLSVSTPLMKSMITECAANSPLGDYVSWATEPANTKYVGQLASDLDASAKASGYDYFHEAEFIQSFVGSAIPYEIALVPQLPAQTLFDSGDCKDKSILYASILEALGYKVALFAFSPITGTTGHEAVGVAFTDKQMTQTAVFPTSTPLSYYPQNGENYYFAETTAPGWLLGERSYPESALVYPLN